MVRVRQLFIARRREWFNVSFMACRSCAHRANWLGQLYLIPWILCFIASFPLFMALAVLVAMADPSGNGWEIILGFVMPFVVLIGLGISIGNYRNRQVPQFLGRELDRGIRRFAGINRWGLMGAFYPRSRVPRGENRISMNEFLAMINT